MDDEKSAVRRIVKATAKLRLTRWRYFLWGAIFALSCSVVFFLTRLIGLPSQTFEFESKSIRRDDASYDRSAVEESLILIGDAGDAPKDLLAKLTAESLQLPKVTTVIFLGDNIYPRGLPSKDSPHRAEAERRLNAQIDAVRDTGVRTVFVPGNHDWDFSGPDGWEAVKRQDAYVRAKLGPASFSPSNGCPGPEVAAVTKRFRVLALDSEWWMRTWSKPVDESSGCKTFRKEGILAKLDELLRTRSPGVHDFVVGHHPLESDGRHSTSSHCPGNMLCPAYIEMREKLLSAMDRYKPFLCAGGHDHSLQLLKNDRGCRYFVVSGAASNTTGFRPSRASLLAYDELGFFRIDALKDGRVALKIHHFVPAKSWQTKVLWLHPDR